MSPHLEPVAFEGLRPVLDTVLDAVLAIRPDGTVIAWNKVAESTFGWSAEEAVGQAMADLIVPEQHREAHCKGLERYLRTGEQRVLNRRIEITAMRKSGEEFPVELSITTAALGGEDVFIGFLRDISERRDAEATIRRQAREAELLFRVTRMAAETDSFEEALHSCLEAISDLTGWPVGHALVSSAGGDELVSTQVWFEASEGAASAMQEATAGIRFTAGVGLPGLILKTGEPVWLSDVDTDPLFIRKGHGFRAAFGFPIKSEAKIIAALEFFTHSTTLPDNELMLTVRTLGEQVGRVIERKRTEEHQRLLVNELNHRVKNTLALVQSLAAQTFKEGTADASARAAFDERLAALAGAHDVLTDQHWESASLHQVIEKTGLGCGADSGRVRVQGPDISFDPKTAVALAMALHELCTNAVKYGALSNADGTVCVSCDIVDGGAAPRLLISWEERGGPAVSMPERRGFGSRMIERVLASELSGSANLEFLPTGLLCVIEAPLQGNAVMHS